MDLIPYMDSSLFWKKYTPEVNQIFNETLMSKSYQGDECVREFEEKMVEYTGRKYAIAVNSCTDALTLTLRSLKLDPGSEIIVPAFGFVATGSAVLNAGHKPVFVDVWRDGIMSSSSLEKVITNKTKAIIVTTLFGNKIDRISFIQFFNTLKPAIIVDNAQGLSQNTYRDGIFNCLSFDPMKPFSNIGSGGMILTDEKMYDFFLKGLRRNDYTLDIASTNSQMSSLSSNLLLFKLNKQQEILNEYKRIILTYRYNLQLRYGIFINSTENLLHKFCIQSKKRNQLKQYLYERGIETKIHYSYILPNLKMFGSEDINNYPNAKKLSEELLSLPLYPGLSNDKIMYICDTLNSFPE